MNKRDFMAGAGALAAACTPALAAVEAHGGQVAPRAPRLPPLEGQQRRDLWVRYVGQDFRAAQGDVLRLIRVVDAAQADGHAEHFRLVFSAADGASVASGLHELQHTSGQRVSVYLDAAGIAEFHAQFNLLV